jgi:hypothetical protein
MRMVPGKSFTLGDPDLSVPVGKTWEVLLGPQGESRQFLIESTPYMLIKPQLDVLPVRTAMKSPRKMEKIQTALLQLKTPPLTPSDGTKQPHEPHVPRMMAKAQIPIDAEPGVVLDYLIVNSASINVNFANNTKSGFAAIGQTANDHWNAYVQPYANPGALANLLRSDQSQSTVGLIVSNAPGQWGNSYCVDPMYQSYIYPWNAGHIIVTITNLPADTYDFYVYATRASGDGAPVVELKRAGTSLWTKGTTRWGNGWHSTYWDEQEQYVRFRNIAVNNQTIVLDFYPDSAGYASVSGLQIVPSSAIPSEQPTITKLLNVNFGGNTTDKTGFAAAGLTANDYWTGYTYHGSYAVSVPNLKWSDQTTSSAGMIVLNAPGSWGNTLPDMMFRSYKYAQNAGNITITLTNLPAGICDVYLYGHTPTADDNAVFELWSDDVNWGVKGTSLIGTGPTAAAWELGQQYVRFKDVTVTGGKPVIIQAKHTTYGYNNLSGMQIAYTGNVDTDADTLPDGWERRCFNNLSQTANGDFDSDGLNNVREYQLGTDSTRTDSNANGLLDLNDFEAVWLEDATPQGSYLYSGGGDTWNWVTSWSGGGWGGATVLPHSGAKMHMSANVPNAMHQHYFDRSLAVIRPGVGDMIYAWINLDSTYPPSEVMLQFYVMENNGSYSWEHRAYWGANLINGGVNGTASRYPMGALPTAGQWVRLEVPASVLGLEGKIIEGIAFTLYGGRAAWDSAGSVKPDRDGDALPDWWEMQHFGNLAHAGIQDSDGDGLSNVQEYQLGKNPTNADTDGDGTDDGDEDSDGDELTDSEEFTILVDVNYPSVGHLDPRNPKSGRAGKFDGELDSDHDGLSNLAELRYYFSNPANAHTYSTGLNDAEYFHTARVQLSGAPPPPPSQVAMALGLQVNLGGGMLQFTISDTFPGARYDLYFVNNIVAPRWQWRRVYSEIVCDANGIATFTVEQPDPNQGYFVILSAEDGDLDGLTDGYESWFTYVGQKTEVNQPDSEGDQMFDGWEVQYGINPMVATGNEGPTGDPDSDSFVNKDEHDFYSFSFPSYDPLKVYNTVANRPVVTIFNSTANPGCAVASFTISRFVGDGGSLSGDLKVYYSVGGNLKYGTDYTLNLTSAQLAELPRIYSATIPNGQSSVTVTASLVGNAVPSGTKTLVATITPYSVSPVSPVSDPLLWAYVVDWNQNRTTMVFDFDNLRPRADDQTVLVCPNIDKPITLTGSDDCNDPLTFSVVNGPLHGTLLGTAPNLTYRPNNGYTGPDSFTFKVNDGLRDSTVATVSITVGDKPVADSQFVQACRNTDEPITLTGSGVCGTLTFSVLNGPTHGILLGTAPNLIYRPDTGYEGPDSFTFKVNNGFSDSDPATVSIEVGYLPVADDQTRVTDIGRPINITLTGSDQCNDPLTYSIVIGPTLGTLGGMAPNVSYTPNTAGNDNFTFNVNDGVLDSVEATVDVDVLPLPVLSASCRPRSIVLEWSLPDWAAGRVQDWVVYRATIPGGPYTVIATLPDNSRSFVDTTVVSGTYCYRVSFHYEDPGPATTHESRSAEVCSSICCPPSTQFWTDHGPTPQQLSEWLARPGDVVTVVSFSDAPVARGIFGGGISAGLPIDTGMIFSSGDINLATGPNDRNGAGIDHPFHGNDDDLDALLDPLEPQTTVDLDTEDASFLEFDLTPATTGTLQFDYIFSSEEYPEYLAYLKNDAVAIFVNEQNIAWVPNTTDPVCVFTINAMRNTGFYRENPPTPDEVFDLQYDGFTSTATHPWLTASVAVQASVTVRIKIVIADEDDGVYDSAVFIRPNRPIPCP